MRVPKSPQPQKANMDSKKEDGEVKQLLLLLQDCMALHRSFLVVPLTPAVSSLNLLSKESLENRRFEEEQINEVLRLAWD